MTLDIPTLMRAIEGKRVELPGLKTAAEELQATIMSAFEDVQVPEGANPEVARGLALLSNEDAFTKVDEGWRPYSEAKSDLDQLQQNLLKLMEAQGFNDGGAGRPQLWGRAEAVEGGGPVTRHANLLEKASAVFTGSDAYKAAQEWARAGSDPLGSTSSIEALSRAETKALVTGASSTSGGAFVIEDRKEFLPFLAQQPLVAGMVGVGETDSDLVEYVEQDAFTNAAAPTAEGVAASESAVTYVRTSPVEEITHFIPATKRALADAAQLRSLLENDLLVGELRELDQQILTGSGATTQLEGIYNATGVQSQALGADTRADVLHKAITKIRVAFGEPDGILFHPNDYEVLRLEKDGTGRYLFGEPSGSGATTVWGVPSRQSTFTTSGQPLVGDFRGGARLWIREGVGLSASDSHSTFFTERKVALLAAMRAAFKTVRPTHFTIVTGF